MTVDPHTLTAAYAAHALSEDERVDFERHLRTCDDCAQEVRELRATLARLGAAAAVEPPPQMWERVRAGTETVRQLPPRDAGTRGATIIQLRRWLAPARLTAAALLIVAVVLGVVNRDLDQRLRQTRQEADRVAAVLAAPDAELHEATSRPGAAAAGYVVSSRARGETVFVASGLPPAPESRSWQVWFIGPGGPRSAGVLATGSAGVSSVLDSGLGDAGQVALTLEPRGGSPRPTTDPVLVVDV